MNDSICDDERPLSDCSYIYNMDHYNTGSRSSHYYIYLKKKKKGGKSIYIIQSYAYGIIIAYVLVPHKALPVCMVLFFFFSSSSPASSPHHLLTSSSQQGPGTGPLFFVIFLTDSGLFAAKGGLENIRYIIKKKEIEEDGDKIFPKSKICPTPIRTYIVLPIRTI